MAPKYCCVKGCFTNSENKMGLSLFSFPKEQERCTKWVNNCGRQDLHRFTSEDLNKNYRICGLHFEQKMFAGLSKNRLKKNAIPTLNISDSPIKDTFSSVYEISKTDNSYPSTSQECSSAVQNIFIQEALPVAVKLEYACPSIVQETPHSHSILNNENKFSQSQQLHAIEIPQEVQSSTETVQSLYNKQLQYQLPHENVAVPSIQGSIENLLPTLLIIGNSTNQVFQIPIKFQVNEVPKEYKCRTCLKLTNETTCTGITKICFSNRTLKYVITQLVPQMELTLNDSDVICNDCFRILESCMKFILQCLETEEKLNMAKVVGDRCSEIVIDECDLIETSSTADDGILMSNESEHDYCVKPKPIADSFSNIEVNGNNSILESLLSGRLKTRKQFRTASSLKVLVPGDIKPKVKKKYKKKVVPKKVEKNSEKMFSCTVCSEKFTSEDFKIHLEIHPPHICDICGKAFVKKNSLKAHKTSHNNPNAFICEICGRGCKEYLALMRHRETHTSEKSMVCEKCAKMFRNKRQLTVHMRYVHNRNFTVQCPHCGLMSRTPSVLQSHIKLVHLKVKPHQCNICGKRFGRRDYLQQHLETHATAHDISNKESLEDSEECPRTKVIVKKDCECVPCKLCGKVVEGRRLKTHLKRHINRYKCHYCPQTFVAKCTRNEHEVVHETMSVFFRCNVCYRKFKTKEELERHAATQVHRRPPRYSCDICGKKFHRRFSLSQHTLTQHVTGSKKEALHVLVYDDVLQNESEV